MALKFNLMGVFLIASLVAVGGVIVAHTTVDEDPVSIDIIVDGEGTVEPIPGLYSIEKGNTVTLDMQAAEGWLLSIVSIDDDHIEFGTHSASLDIVMDEDKVIVVHFISPEVEIPETSSYVFDGSEVVAYRDNQFYTVEDGYATNAGEYEARFTLRHPDFCHWSDGTIEDKVVTWNIDPKQISTDDFRSVGDVVYTGKQVAPVPAPIAPLTTDDFTVTYGDNKDVGTGTIDIVAKNNFTGNVVIEFDILKKALTLSTFVDDDDNEIIYGDDAPDYGYDIDGFVDGEDKSDLTGSVSLSCAYEMGDDVGKYVIDASGVSSTNYEVVKDLGELVVKPFIINDTHFQIDDSTEVYNGTEHSKTVTKADGLDFIRDGIEYDVIHEDNVDAGQAKVTVKAKGNCEGQVSEVFIINKKPITVSVNNASKTYGEQDPQFSASITGVVASDDGKVTYSIAREAGEDVKDGGYKLTATVDDSTGNYDITAQPGALFIQKRPITFISEGGTKTYDGSPLVKYVAGIDEGTLASGDYVTYNFTGSQTDVGSSPNTFTAVFNGEKGENYLVTYEYGTLVVTKKTGSIVITADSVTKMYDGQEITFFKGTQSSPEFTDKGFSYVGTLASSDRIEVKFSYASRLKDVGTQTNDILEWRIVRNGSVVSDSYESVVVNDGSFIIAKRYVTLISDSESWVYDGSVHGFQGDLANIYGNGFVDGEGVNVAYTNSIKDVGSKQNTFDITAKEGTNLGNYEVSKVYGTLTVMPKDVSVKVANSYSKVYGDEDPTFGATIEGLIGSDTITYSFIRVSGEDVGNYRITPIGQTYQGNYKVTFVDDSSKALTITPKSIVSADIVLGPELTYNGSEQEKKVISVIVDGSVVTYDVSGNKQTNAGSFELKITGKGNFSGERTVAWSIGKADYDMSGVTFEDVIVTYDGTEKGIKITGILPTGADRVQVKVSYSAGSIDVVTKKVITATFSTASTNYNVPVSMTAELTILPKQVSAYLEDDSFVYNGTQNVVKVKLNGIVSNDVVTAIVTEGSDKAINAGDYKVKVTGIDGADKGNYALVGTELPWSITKKDIDGATVTLGPELIYNGGVQNKQISSVVIDRLTVTYDVSGNSQTNTGDYTLVITGTGNFTGTVYKQWSIAPLDLKDTSVTVTLSGTALVFDGSMQTKGVTIAFGNTALVEGTDYYVSGNSAINADAYNLSIKGLGNFTGTVSKPWSIAKKNIDGATVTLGPELTYNGDEQEKQVDSAVVDGLTVTYDVSDNKQTDAGSSYELKITGNGNFTGTVSKGWSIAQKDISFATVTLDRDSFTYDGEPKTVSVTSVGVDGLTVTYSGTTGIVATDAGTYTVTTNGNGNFTGTATTTWRIEPKDISAATVTLDKDSFTYDGTSKTVSVTSVKIGDLTVTCSDTTGTEATDAGTYTVTTNGNGNFTGTATTTWRIDPRTLSITDFEKIQPMVYIGAQLKPGVSLSEAGVDNGLNITRDCDITYGPNASPGKGAGSVTVSSKVNATGSVTLYFDVYTGLTVYVTKDGSGNSYADGSWRLSDFTGTRSLFDMNNIYVGSKQTAQMYIPYQNTYDDLYLGILVKDLVGTPAIGVGNHLHQYVKLTLECGGETVSATVDAASDSVIQIPKGIGELHSNGKVTFDVTMELVSGGGSELVQGKRIDFDLVVCILPNTGRGA